MRQSYSGTFILFLLVVNAVSSTEICEDEVQQHLEEPFECELDECIQNQRKKLFKQNCFWTISGDSDVGDIVILVTL